MGKIAEIINDSQERAFDLVREPDALYLCVKCSSHDKHSRLVKIKVSDVLYQIWRKLTIKEKRNTCTAIKNLIREDKEIA